MELVDAPCNVWISKFAEKQLKKLPRHIVAAFYTWVKSVELDGIRKTRRIAGYHDEPLRGERKGQRSVRLSRAYRVIYEETESGSIILVGVLEVNKHEY
jgi:proteic killer suppression protein